MTQRAFAADEMLLSQLENPRLLALALTLPTVPGRSELYGRSHAYYAIAASQQAAIEHVMTWAEQGGQHALHVMAARALAAAGYDLAAIKALA
jgi:hypothetical protein